MHSANSCSRPEDNRRRVRAAGSSKQQSVPVLEAVTGYPVAATAAARLTTLPPAPLPIGVMAMAVLFVLMEVMVVGVMELVEVADPVEVVRKGARGGLIMGPEGVLVGGMADSISRVAPCIPWRAVRRAGEEVLEGWHSVIEACNPLLALTNRHEVFFSSTRGRV